MTTHTFSINVTTANGREAAREALLIAIAGRNPDGYKFKLASSRAPESNLSKQQACYERIKATCEFRSLPSSGHDNCFHPGLPHICRCDRIICGKLTAEEAQPKTN